MQIDMHYYGVYAIARAAGMRADAARAVATACQFVDDATSGQVGVHPAGARFRAFKTAHHPWNLSANNDADDQIDVWVPFHFLPGNQGENLLQRLICQKDSAIAREMIDDHIAKVDRPWGLQLLGIGLHTYLDTFSHYGFSGISSLLNRVRTDNLEIYEHAPAVRDYLGGRIEKFFVKYGDQGGLLSGFRTLVSRGGAELSGADTEGALGHGAVAVYPDQPYLKWSFAYEFPALVGDTFEDRDNQADYLAGCAAVHRVITAALERRPELADGPGRPFYEIEAPIRELLAFVGNSGERATQWQLRVADGALYAGADRPVPTYHAETWRQELVGLSELSDPREALYSFSFRFNQAAHLHRAWVLHELLPSNGIALV